LPVKLFPGQAEVVTVTIGEYIALKQPVIFEKLMKFCRCIIRRTIVDEPDMYIDRLMREVPGFWRDERLPR